MKKLKSIPVLFTLLFMGLLLSSCGKTDPNGHMFNLSLNGTSMSGTNKSYAQEITASPTTLVYGKVSASNIIQFSLLHCDTVGTYSIAVALFV